MQTFQWDFHRKSIHNPQHVYSGVEDRKRFITQCKLMLPFYQASTRESWECVCMCRSPHPSMWVYHSTATRTIANCFALIFLSSTAVDSASDDRNDVNLFIICFRWRVYCSVLMSVYSPFPSRTRPTSFPLSLSLFLSLLIGAIIRLYSISAIPNNGPFASISRITWAPHGSKLSRYGHETNIQYTAG